ncbi:MAG: ABC transporter permease [Chloroflexi bacterium]|nr:ABC transporter permease [Chloroflexota bacterium]OJW05451.1 MAG: ABC transporter permease [Chloroflexi bacterium 54-19]
MLSIIVRRLAISIVLILVVTFLTYLLQSFLPGDAARAMLGLTGSPDQYQAMRKALHLDEPLIVQYWLYLAGLLRFDLGNSIFTQEPVAHSLAVRSQVSASLVVGTTLVATLLGVGLGMLSVLRGGIIAKILDVFALIAWATPGFWLALLLTTAFSVAIPIFPAIGYIDFEKDLGGWAKSLVLPVAAMSVGGIAAIARITRESMSRELEKEYIRTLRASGVGTGSLVWKHALKNAGLTIITVIGLVFIGSMLGTIFIEQVFALPGLGSLLIDATRLHDIPVIQGVALAFTLTVVVVNLLVDLSYTWLNPKVRTS